MCNLAIDGAIQGGIGGTLVAKRQMVRFLVLLRLALLRIRQVRNCMHGGTLLAEAEQQCERDNQKHAAEHTEYCTALGQR